MAIQIKNPLDIRVGEARVLPLQLLASDPQEIFESVSNDDGDALVLKVPQHGFTTSQLLVIYDHETIYGKSSNANGTVTATVIDDDHLSVTCTPNGKGNKSGFVAVPEDLTSAVVAAQIRNEAEEDSPLVFEYNSDDLVVGDPTHGKIELVLAEDDSDGAEFVARQGQTVFEAVKVDGVERLVNKANVIGRTVQEVAP